MLSQQEEQNSLSLFLSVVFHRYNSHTLCLPYALPILISGREQKTPASTSHTRLTTFSLKEQVLSRFYCLPTFLLLDCCGLPSLSACACTHFYAHTPTNHPFLFGLLFPISWWLILSPWFPRKEIIMYTERQTQFSLSSYSLRDLLTNT